MSILGRAKVITDKTVGDQLASAHLSGVSTLALTDVREFAPGPGQVYINGDIYPYSSVDDVANTLALTTPTTAAYAADEWVALYPIVPFKIAMVQIETTGPSIPVFVPHEWMALLAEGLYDPGIEVEIVSEPTREYPYRINQVIGRAPLFDASTTPVTSSTDGGERVYLDGNGLTLYTDDPIQTLSYTAISLAANAVNAAGGIASDSAGNTYMVGSDNVAGTATGYLKKFGPTGLLIYKVTLAALNNPNTVRLDGAGNVWVGTGNSPGGIYKYNPTTGAFVSSVLGGLNIVDFAIDPTGRFYVLTGLTGDYKIYTAAGALVRAVALSTTGQNIAVDTNLNVAVAVGSTNQIFYYNAADALVNTITATKCGGGVVFDPAGNIIATNQSAGVPVLGVRFNPTTGAILTSWTIQPPAGTLLLWSQSRQLLTIDPAGKFLYWRDPLLERVIKFNAPGNLFAAVELSTLLGRLLGLNATIAGNLEVDSITSANGLQMLSLLQLAAGAAALSGGFAVNADSTGKWDLRDDRITPTIASISASATAKIVAQWTIPPNWFLTGRLARILLDAQVSTTATIIWKIYMGPLGTNADPLLVTFDTSPANTGTLAHAMVDAYVRCIDAAHMAAFGFVTNGVDLGDGVGPVNGVTTNAAVDTTKQNILSVEAKLSSATNLTTNVAYLEKLRG